VVSRAKALGGEPRTSTWFLKLLTPYHDRACGYRAEIQDFLTLESSSRTDTGYPKDAGLPP